MINPPSMPHSSLRLRAPAKINWFLEIIGKRDDGYHDIRSVMHSVTLFDTLLFSPSDHIEIVSDLDIPAEQNLAYKAAHLLSEKASCRKGVRITLQKEIPVSAGLAGGSSDAAQTLLGLNEFWGIGLRKDELIPMGLLLGSDIPFFFSDSCALIEGRGEKMTPLHTDLHLPLIILLAKPAASVSTAWAYQSRDAGPGEKLTKKPVDIKLFCQALYKQDFALLGVILNNDLENAVTERYPVIMELKKGMVQEGALFSAMSGSGPTVFGVFQSRESAENAAREISPFWYRIVETIG
jgi:4-diphosphocytidyl-2-C-methyl-D-erythritol kinase